LKKAKLSRSLAIAWFILTTILLCLPGSVLPKENWFDKIWLDKWVHIGLFSTMTVLLCWTIRERKGKKIMLFVRVAFYCLLYGIAMEFVQKYFIPNRSFDVKDMLADAVGCSLGLVVSLRLL
jgi:VanZ family protein